MYEMHGKDLLGARVTVEHAKVRCMTFNNLLSAPFLFLGGAFGFALSFVLSIFFIFCGCTYIMVYLYKGGGEGRTCPT